MKTALLALSAALLLAPLGGCVVVSRTYTNQYKATNEELATTRRINPGDPLPTVRARYAQELSRLYPGMPAAEFRQAVPDATFIERRFTDRGTMDLYTLRVSERYHFAGSRFIHNAADLECFWFQDERFVKWGDIKQPPEGWNSKAGD